MPEVRVDMPEPRYSKHDIIIHLLGGNQIAFKRKDRPEHLIMPIVDETTWNIAISMIRGDLEEQGILHKEGEPIKKKCKNCGKEMIIEYKRRKQEFCDLSCANQHTSKKLHAEGRIKFKKDEKTGKFVKDEEDGK